MIKIIHNTKHVVKVFLNETLIDVPSKKFSKVLFYIANKNPNEKIVWIDNRIVPNFNWNILQTIDINDKEIVFASNNNDLYLTNDIGFIDQNSLFRIPKEVSSFSWMISGDIGLVKASLINRISIKDIELNDSPNYFLHSLGIQLIKNGLFCRREPKLLLNGDKQFKEKKLNNFQLYKFVKQNYKVHWIIILFYCQLIYKRKFNLAPLLFSLFIKKRKFYFNNVSTSKCFEIDYQKVTVDVLIPTLGRKKFLKDFLIDLSEQTLKPKKVIIIEQNGILNSESELDYLFNEPWPFEIVLKFTHQLGACNARNIGLEYISNDWVFMADDDIRISNDFLEKSFLNILSHNFNAVNLNCLQKGQVSTFNNIHQTEIFGSGASIVKTEILKNCKYDMNYEFCFGEDFDFGMQIRNQGLDVVYLPEPIILHLKAPVGGFRIKPVLPWSNDEIIPNPSPTILLNFLKYKTKEQLLSYKTLYFYNKLLKSKLKFYSTLKKVKLQWEASEIWAKKILVK
ncbi:Glycosyl transferase, group 2 family protein [Flavobacterium indicum GPTSA100-9 = DSM 17447]|uniref:Glycosyl transferase, group 2 family protein n=1 Tax=Flavobacterium indicum (strain DSM 17447 / CIP 109464 / GPTSA100-9) TaxID=1094466 RepID=H8XT82_FLAIG|nr:glycosyltransferase family A protein [Flavobacterium indicum]CCG52679.1 Glycosyl transferase, group 2 family protein [Flavobacterium indicum GPTSA100-9 = DSM 17447]